MVYHVNRIKYLVFLHKMPPLPAVAIVCIFIAFVDPSQCSSTVIYYICNTYLEQQSNNLKVATPLKNTEQENS